MDRPEPEAMDTQAAKRNSRKRSRDAATDATSGSSLSSPNPKDASTDKSETPNEGDDEQEEQQQQQQQLVASSHLPSPDQTPKKKRVRFSDPVLVVPRRTASLSGTTGLTPTFMRTSIAASQSEQNEEEEEEPQTPSRRNRRKTAPTVVSDPIVFDPVRQHHPPVQYYPMRQALDPRTARYLWRRRLSEEQNAVEQEKKEEKTALEQAEAKIKELTDILQSAKSTEATNDLSENFDIIPVGDDSMMEDSVLVSESPVLNTRYREEGTEEAEEEVPGSSHTETSLPTTSPKTPTADSSVQVDILEDWTVSEEDQLMSAEISAARKKKQNIFRGWRKPRTGQPESEPEPQTQNESPGTPPPDFMSQIVPAMESAIQQASSADQALEMVHGELSNMGFSGATVDEILTQLRESIRSARLELESIIPGETPASLTDGKSTMEALVKIMKQSSGAFLAEHQRANSLSKNNKALSNEFNKTLQTLESERLRLKKIEERADVSAEDMLHVRMRILKLENELTEKGITIERLSQALSQYYEDVKNYEAIIEKQDAEKTAEREVSASQIAELRAQLAKKPEIVLEQGKESSVLADLVKSGNYSINDLVDVVLTLEAKNERLVDELAEREREIGKLNARISQESTALQSATMDLEKLGSQRKQEAEFHHRLRQAVSEWMDQGKKIHWDVQAQRAKMNGNPILASSPTKTVGDRWLENVRVGRGKDYRTLETGNTESNTHGRDSGIDLIDNSSLDKGAVSSSNEGDHPMDELPDVNQEGE